VSKVWSLGSSHTSYRTTCIYGTLRFLQLLHDVLQVLIFPPVQLLTSWTEAQEDQISAIAFLQSQAVFYKVHLVTMDPLTPPVSVATS
jgi:hypothetical protein